MVGKLHTTTTIMEINADYLERATASNKLIEQLVGCIPADIYLRNSETSNNLNEKYMVNKKGNAPKQDVKDASKKGKRARLDPEARSVVAQQAAMANEEAKTQAAQDSSDDEDMQKPAGDQSVSNGATRTGPVFKHLSHQQLRERLRQSQEQLRAKRKADVNANRKKQKEKVANKRAKLKEERKTKGLAKAPHVPGSGADRAAGAADGSTPAKKSKVLFSKFDLGDARKPKSKPTPQQLLQQAEAKSEKMKQLRQSNPEKAAEVEKKDAWSKALQKAEGQKVFDNPSLVKKKIKRIEQAKKKSQLQWTDRESEVKKQQKERQDARQKNLQARIDAKREKKIKKLKKSGRLVGKPGF